MPSKLAKLAIDQLSHARARLADARVLIGFDGFVDTIIHVVAQRESAAKYTRMATISEFGRRVSAAAGVSANFEFVTQRVKLGGNGPIMANALGSYGAPVTYVGNLGFPAVHPVFADLAKRARVISIAEPAYTDAIEFEDGKLMCGKHESLQQVNWATLLKHLPEEQIVALFEESTLIAMVNWTMLPHMSALWQKIRTKVAPRLTPTLPGKAGGEKRWLFFDLADPAKRTREDIASALDAISKFQKHFRVILGLNFEESRQIGEVLGIAPPESIPEQVSAHAGRLREMLGVDTVVIHPTRFAAAADSSGCAAVEGPFTAKPKITTGAGDHFNAGFCLGRMLGANLDVSLQIGVATSGYYVRHAKSPGLNDLKKFLQEL